MAKSQSLGDICLKLNLVTEEQLDQALFVAERHKDSFCLLDVHLDPLDRSPALQRLAERLAQKL